LIILTEQTAQVAKEVKDFVTKLRNMKLHLSELINKKARLDLEIKHLRKTIIVKQKEHEVQLKLKLKLDPHKVATKEQQQHIIRESPELADSILELDLLETEILQLLQQIDEK
jgi:regulator of replication initiation timing